VHERREKSTNKIYWVYRRSG